MARSNQGGTRGFLRGRVASDLYQVTHKSNGRKVQIVRSVEQSRINNNTIEQALARMRMALLMGALSDLKSIVDHSWQGLSYGQLSIANFVKVNMPLVIEDCKENWSVNNSFCYPTKSVAAMRIGAFIIASGTLPSPANITRGVNYSFDRWYPFRILIGKANATFGDLRASLGLNANDYITLLQLSLCSGFPILQQAQALQYVRIYLAENILDKTPITSDNISSMFTYEGNAPNRISYDSSNGVITVQVDCRQDGQPRDVVLSSVIVSRWTGKVWARNNARFLASDGVDSPNFEDQAPRWVFNSWFKSFDPDAEGSEDYPGK